MNNDIINEIAALTETIRLKSPEAHRYLLENPITLPAKKTPDVSNEVFVNYLETLKTILSKLK